jgi:ubiquinone/menaquinone biosynthesis C-methylase UbiE
MSTEQASRIASRYAPLIGIDPYSEGRHSPARTDELLFWNYGFWLSDTTDPKIASLNLLEKLLSQLPAPPAKILDVAFGQGGSLKRLCDIYGASNVTGINIAADQIAHAKNAGISCELIEKDAAEIDFEKMSFDGILCMEAAFHFSTRLTFLKHAHRILKRGGRLVMSDFLMRSGVGLHPLEFPPENYTSSLDEYKNCFTKAGFLTKLTDVEVITDNQLVPFFKAVAEDAGYLPFPNPEKINILDGNNQERIMFILTRLLNISECVVVCAERE